MTFTAEPELRRYLELLVARAYGEIHETRKSRTGWRWDDGFSNLSANVPPSRASFALAVAITLAGCAFGGLPSAWIRMRKRSSFRLAICWAIRPACGGGRRR